MTDAYAMPGAGTQEAAGTEDTVARVALVTGASRGIGAAIARRLARDFAVVVHYAADRAAAEGVLEAIVGGGGTGCVLQADFTRPDAPAGLIAAVVARFGRIDVLVNNAALVEPLTLDAMEAAHADRLLAVNVRAVLLGSRHAAAAMAPGSSIVNIGSINGRQAVPTASVYAASKAAVESLTRTLAHELGPRGIRVNAVAPGLIMTERQVARLPAAVLAQERAETPLGRLGQPDDIARVVAFLASADAGWITGETIVANGGRGV